MMRPLAVVVLPDRSGRPVPKVVTADAARKLQAELARRQEQQRLAAEQYARFRNAPRTLADAFRDPAWLGGQAAGTALGLATGTMGVGMFFSALVTDLLRRKADFTVGRPKSPIRAVGGLPFSGLRDISTGVVTRPRSVSQIVAALRTLRTVPVGRPIILAPTRTASPIAVARTGTGGGGGVSSGPKGGPVHDGSGDQRNSSNPFGGRY